VNVDCETSSASERSPLQQFNSWGIRWASGKLVFNISRNRGVLIRQANERSILTGPQRVEELVIVIDKIYDCWVAVDNSQPTLVR
jgi:hypothetical protein